MHAGPARRSRPWPERSDCPPAPVAVATVDVYTAPPRKTFCVVSRRSESPMRVGVLRVSGGDLLEVSRVRDFEDEPVLANADPVALGQRHAASDSTSLYDNAVGRAQIGDDRRQYPCR